MLCVEVTAEDMQIKASQLQTALEMDQAQELQQTLEQMQAQMRQTKQLMNVNASVASADSETELSEVLHPLIPEIVEHCMLIRSCVKAYKLKLIKHQKFDCCR